MTKSYDSSNNLPNSNARQRRREIRMQTSVESPTQTASDNIDQDSTNPIPKELNSAEIEKKKEGYVTL